MLADEFHRSKHSTPEASRMFGRKIDYLILRSLSHDRNKRTEEALNAEASRQAPLAPEQAAAKLKTHIDRFDGHLPLDPALRYLDMGCGTGELTVALAMLGLARVTGVDMVPRHIEAARVYADQARVADSVDFVLADLNTWQPPEKFDVLLSFDAFEHIDDARGFLKRMAGLVKPDGMAAVGFGPLFHSPRGDHMSKFFRVQIPWRGVLFNEKALLQVRRECYRPTDPAKRLQDIVGGLNQMRYTEFVRYARETGWVFDYLGLNVRLRRRGVIGAISNILTATPIIKDYFVFSVYAILRRA
jgi:SAM-dependent methyltransferase